MDPKDIRQRLGEEQKATVSSKGKSPSQWQPGRNLGVQALWAVRGELERAQNEYYLGNYDSAADILRKLMVSLEQHSVPYAGACVWLALTNERLGSGEDARAGFERAVETFDQWLGHTEKRLDQYHSEYGISLFNTEGRQDDAIDHLRLAISLGVANSETYRHLGLALKNREEYEEAEAQLKKALELTPEDPLIYEALEETFETQGQLQEAASVYREVAFFKSLTSRFTETLSVLNHSLLLHPDDLETLAVKGEVLGTLGRYEEALEALDRALALEPGYAFALGVKGGVLYGLGRYKEALEALDQALALEPEYAFALGTKGQVLRGLNRNEEAVEVLRGVVGMDPSITWAHAELGEVLRVLGRYEEALEALDQALALEPEYAFALGTKGQVLRELNRNKEAVEVLQRAEKMDSGAAWVRAELGEALLWLERYDEALGALDRALLLAPDDLWALVIKGETLRMLQRYEEALLALDLALALEPKYVFALAIKGGVLYVLERYDEALGVLDRALALEPDYAWALGVKGLVLCDIADYQLAIQVLDKAVNLGLSEAWVFGLKGWALMYLGVEWADEAREAYEAAHNLAPEDLYFNKGLGDSLYILRRVEEAEAKFRWVIDQATKANDDIRLDADIMSLVGWCHYRLGQYEDAVRYFIHALTLNNNMVYAHFDLALALMCDERYSRALREYKLTLQLAQSKHVLRRRALFHVALQDLKLTVERQQKLEKVEEVREVLSLLRNLWSKVKDSSSVTL
jgi:tetratricopeptide (TPR) repeat protein